MTEIQMMCRRFALQEIAAWKRREAFPTLRAQSRKMALWWLSQMRGRK